MRRVWAERDIDAPATVVWDLFTDLEAWPRWGPSVRGARLDDGDRLGPGSRGTVTTVVGIELPFEVVSFDPGTSWSWKVAGITATDHEVVPLDPQRCRARIGVPWIAAPYLAVCRAGVQRLGALAVDAETATP